MSEPGVRVLRPCHRCGGRGVVGEVTKEMATDAGYSEEVVGQPISCNYCGGQGWLEDIEIVEVPE